jgi:hypothetical protein
MHRRPTEQIVAECHCLRVIGQQYGGSEQAGQRPGSRVAIRGDDAAP